MNTEDAHMNERDGGSPFDVSAAAEIQASWQRSKEEKRGASKRRSRGCKATRAASSAAAAAGSDTTAVSQGGTLGKASRKRKGVSAIPLLQNDVLVVAPALCKNLNIALVLESHLKQAGIRSSNRLESIAKSTACCTDSEVERRIEALERLILQLDLQ